MSVGSWLFKKIALDPLRSDIQMLSETINRQLKLHEQSLAKLAELVVNGAITADQYQEITGEEYVAA